MLKHVAAILAFAAPTTNSYCRLVPGFEAPVIVALSARIAQLPSVSDLLEVAQGESHGVPLPDPKHPYLAFSAMVMAMLDGIRTGLTQGIRWLRHLRDFEGRARASIDAGLAGCGASGDGGRPPLLYRRRRLHRRPYRDMDRLEARQRDRPAAPAPAPARVLPVLRQLNPGLERKKRQSLFQCAENRRAAQGRAFRQVGIIARHIPRAASQSSLPNAATLFENARNPPTGWSYSSMAALVPRDKLQLLAKRV